MALFYLDFSSDLPFQSQFVEIEDVRYRIEARFNSRTANWYIDIEDEEGNEIVSGEALTPQGFPAGGVLDAPTFFVAGDGPTAIEQRVNTLGDQHIFVFGAE